MRIDRLPAMGITNPNALCRLYAMPEPLWSKVRRYIIRTLLAAIYIGWIALCVYFKQYQAIIPMVIPLGVYIGFKLGEYL